MVVMYNVRNRTPFVNYTPELDSSVKNMQTFDSEKMKRYYSSINTEIYFGNYFVDEIVNIAYSVSQNNMPLYGFNSYVFDEVSLGSRMIQGQFTINFTRPRYLFDLLSAADTNAQTKYVESDKSSSEDNIVTEYKDVVQSKRPFWYQSFTIEVLFGQDDNLTEANHVAIEDVYIQNSNLVLDATGQPIAEQYTFIAKDVTQIG